MRCSAYISYSAHWSQAIQVVSYKYVGHQNAILRTGDSRCLWQSARCNGACWLQIMAGAVEVNANQMNRVQARAPS